MNSPVTMTLSNGCCMALLGISIVFSGLILLSLVIGLFARFLIWWKAHAKDGIVRYIRDVLKRKDLKAVSTGLAEQDFPTGDVIDVEAALRRFSDQLGIPFKLPELFRLAEKCEIQRPHWHVSQLLLKGSLSGGKTACFAGVREGIYPPLIFLGIGTMTDFSTLLARPKLILLGAAAQIGVFGTFVGALFLGFIPREAASIGIIGGADGPTAIFLSSKLAPELLGPIAIASYSYMALVPIIQPPIMRLLTTRKERLIKMSNPRKVDRLEKIIFPMAGFILCCFIASAAIPLLGMLFFGNLLKECLVTDRLAKTAQTSRLTA